MIVCAHGEVREFCEAHEMQILEKYDGDMKDYRGKCVVVVTDLKMSREEYDRLKCELFGRGIELVSTEWTDDEVILRLLRNQIEQRGKRGGRQMYGFAKKNGVIVDIPRKIVVAKKILEMRDEGMTLRDIQNYLDSIGEYMSMSTIQTIIKNREKYENG